MDRIKTALEKNRVKRRKPALEPVRTSRQESGEHPFEAIEYTHSKRIDVMQNVLAERRLIAGIRTDPRATAFRMLRTQVLHAMRENGWSLLGVTGPTSGIGKSLVATNLAISISMEVNQTVLLVDADLRRPSIHKYFNFEPDQGLLDYLKGEASLSELFINPVYKRLLLLPGRDTTTESSELLSSPRMAHLIDDLRNRYDSRIIIFDLPPLLNVDDTMVLLPHLDATLMVVENGKNTQSEVQNSMHLLQSTNLIGTVLNKADEEIRDYY
jgi:capsular exopolysaccharide synthesis family protein